MLLTNLEKRCVCRNCFRSRKVLVTISEKYESSFFISRSSIWIFDSIAGSCPLLAKFASVRNRFDADNSCYSNNFTFVSGYQGIVVQKSRFKGDWFEIAGSPTIAQSCAPDMAATARAQQAWFL